MHVIFDDSNPSSMKKVLIDDDVDVEKENEELYYEASFAENQEEQQGEQPNLDQNSNNSQTLPKEWKCVSS